MHAHPLIASALVAGAVSVGTHLVLAAGSLAPGRASEAATEPLAPDALAALRDSVHELRDVQRELAERVERLGERATAPAARVSLDDVERAVARYLEKSGAAPAAEGGGPAASLAQTGESTDDLVERLLAGDQFDQDVQELWQRLREEGRMDEVLAAFEARAAADPNNPDKQVELGEAYLQKIQDVGNGPLAGVYATKADGAFDRALELDPRHWGARFDKAVSLSFWPPVFGKQNEAIRQFEVLVAQQAEGAPEAHHADTHLLLGNMYQQIGEGEKALAAWKAGLALFPDDEELLAQLALVQGE